MSVLTSGESCTWIRPMSENEEEYKTFMEQLKGLSINDILYQQPNWDFFRRVYLSDEVSMDHVDPFFAWGMRARSARKCLQGKTFDGILKHFDYDVLSQYTHIIHENFVIGNPTFGRFIKGRLDLDGESQVDVLIKTFDISFPQAPHHSYQRLHPLRLQNEISLQNIEPFKSSPILPKIVGYSIDKTLAIVYRMQSKETLRSALKRGTLDWNDRFRVAMEAAKLLRALHNANITLGSLNPDNIVIDTDGKINVCEFGLCARQEGRQELDIDRGDYNALSGGGAYSSYLPEHYELRKWNCGKRQGNDMSYGIDIWKPTCDIFMFGNMLVELLTRDDMAPHTPGILIPAFACEQVLDDLRSGKSSVLDHFVVDNPEYCEIMASLVEGCLALDPQKRCEAAYVVKQLELLQSISSNKRHKAE